MNTTRSRRRAFYLTAAVLAAAGCAPTSTSEAPTPQIGSDTAETLIASATSNLTAYQRAAQPQDELPGALVPDVANYGDGKFTSRQVANVDGVPFYVALAGPKACILFGSGPSELDFNGASSCQDVADLDVAPLAVYSGHFGLSAVLIPSGCSLSLKTGVAAETSSDVAVVRGNSLSGVLTCPTGPISISMPG